MNASEGMETVVHEGLSKENNMLRLDGGSGQQI